MDSGATRQVDYGRKLWQVRHTAPPRHEDAGATPVCWLGHQTVSRLFCDETRVLPIRIKAGALADRVPVRDLLVSPDHALLVDGALIQAGALVNGSSILREREVPPIFTYYDVEVEDHSLILAENTPAEKLAVPTRSAPAARTSPEGDRSVGA